ncbi:ATP-binding protein [Streptomyces sp. NPDC052020]|uniref:ATP-binding protein n=1 Tax=Streptomyces sp. NPDC052020 TaxID=3155677 RepID=UPI00344126A5
MLGQLLQLGSYSRVIDAVRVQQQPYLDDTRGDVRIPTRRQHVPAARHYVRKALADRGITDDLADRAVLSANELVTNAVSHCRISHARAGSRSSSAAGS